MIISTYNYKNIMIICFRKREKQEHLLLLLKVLERMEELEVQWKQL